MSYSWYPNLSHFTEAVVYFLTCLIFAATYLQASEVYVRDSFRPVALLI